MRPATWRALAFLVLLTTPCVRAAAQPGAAGQARFASITMSPARGCGSDPQGGLACWGQDADGFARAPLLGAAAGRRDQCTADEKTLPCSRVPLRVTVPATVKEVAVGTMHSCALAVDGRVFCWGDNSDGMLGAAQRTVRASATPRLVVTPVRFTTISGWANTTCATTREGVAYCWGLNDHRQGGATGVSCGMYRCIQSPAPVGGTVRFTRLSAGEYRTCGVATDGGAYCWGLAGSPELGGLGSEVNEEESPRPVRVPLPVPVSDVSVGSMHACALGRSGQAYCWGAGSYGGLGNGGTEASTTP
ncbi:MAG TPA: hypothetical protein VF541_03930, partial [Longimicrobium sp.]